MRLWKAFRSSSRSSSPKRASRSSLPSHRRLSSQTTTSVASSAAESNVGTTFVELIKKRNTDLGIIVTLDPISRQPLISELTIGSWAQRSDVLCTHDELISVNNEEARLMSVEHLIKKLDESDRVQLEVRYKLPLLRLHKPNFRRKQQDLRLQKISGSFGLVFRPAQILNNESNNYFSAFVVASVSNWPHSPALKSGRIRVNDRLIAVNNVDVSNMRLPELQAMLYQIESEVLLRMEYEIALEQETSNGPLLIELRREEFNEDIWMGLNVRMDKNNCVLVDNIQEASLAERCGAIALGDQIIAVNGVSVRHMENLEELNGLVRSEKVLRLEVAGSRRSVPQSPLYATHTLRSPSINMQRHRSLSEIAKNNTNNNYANYNNFNSNFNNHTYNNTANNDTTVATRVSNKQQQRRSSFRERHKTVTFTVELDRHDVEPLGLQLASSPVNNTVFVSGLISQGLAERSRAIQINDTLIEVDNYPVTGLSLDRVLSLVQGDDISARFAKLKLARSVRIPERDVFSDTRLRHKPPLPSNPSTPRSRATLASSTSPPLSVHWVTLFKDPVYEDFGFSLSDGKHCRGVFVNRIRPAGPASATNNLKPLDRILQIDGVRTHDFDCCLAVPLIAAAGDKIEMLVARNNGNTNNSLPVARRSFEHNNNFGSNEYEEDKGDEGDQLWKHSALHYIQQGD